MPFTPPCPTPPPPSHWKVLYESVRLAAANLTGAQREVALIFDEISLVGELAFKVVRGARTCSPPPCSLSALTVPALNVGEYRFIGMIDQLAPYDLFGERPATLEEVAQIKAAVATHALVFQISELGEITSPRFRRVVGIHAVGSLVAEQLSTLFWETVRHLQQICEVQVVAAVCDGAGCNRLFQKMAVVGVGARGTSDEFIQGVSAWCHNPWAREIGARIFLISDPSHFIKKIVNNFEKSSARAGTTRNLNIPNFIIQELLQHYPPPGNKTANDDTHTTTGEEFFIRLFRRCYDLLASRNQTNYNSADPIREPRIQELKTILQIVRDWHACNDKIGTDQGARKGEYHKHGLSHQLFFDVQCMIEGFIGLVEYRESRWVTANVRARACSQDSLESLFARLRMACGSGQAVSMMKAVQALPRIDAQTQVRARVAAVIARSTNSGRSGSIAPGAALTGRSGLADSERIRPVSDTYRGQLQRVLGSHWMPSLTAVHWKHIGDLQARDENAFLQRRQQHRFFFWLTHEKHFKKTGFSRMRVGLALDVMSIPTASMCQCVRFGAMHIA